MVDLTPKRPPIDWEKARELYLEEGWSFERIAKVTKYSAHRVRDGLLERGVEPRRRKGLNDRASLALYGLWRHMRRRCFSRSYSGFALCGGRGIGITSEWGEFREYRAWALAHGFRAGMSVSRFDEDADFTPSNCCVVSKEEVIAQRFAEHPPPAHALVKAFGETKGVAEWTRDPRCRVCATTLTRRLRCGVPPEKAIASPPDSRRKPGQKSPPKMRRREPIDWNEARRLYEEAGLSPPAVAREVGCSYAGVLAAFRRLGVELRRQPGLSTFANGKRISRLWSSLRQRCSNPENPLFAFNGARGISVSPEWNRLETFYDWAMESGWKPGLRLVRVDASGNYCPKNCRFTTKSEASQIKRPPSRPKRPLLFITAFGETKGLHAWSRDSRCEVTATSLRRRLRGGMRPEEAITTLPENEGGTGCVKRTLKAFGEAKALARWLEDQRCRVTAAGLQYRLRQGMPVEQALSTPPFKRSVPVTPRRRFREEV